MRQEDVSEAVPSGVGSGRVTRSQAQREDNEHQAPLDTAASPLNNHNNHNQTNNNRRQQAFQPLLRPPRPPKDCSIMKKLADAAAKYLNAEDHSIFIAEMQADDNLIEVAYQRGLLVHFIVRGMSPSQSPLGVDVPEFATVSFLKRQIVKVRLLSSNEYCPVERFSLRRPVSHGMTTENADTELPLISSLRLPILLFDLKFFGGKTYPINMISKRVEEGDTLQQQAMLQRASTGAMAVTHMATSTNPEAMRYQELLHAADFPVKSPRQRVNIAVPPPGVRPPVAAAALASAAVVVAAAGNSRPVSPAGAAAAAACTDARVASTPQRQRPSIDVASTPLVLPNLSPPHPRPPSSAVTMTVAGAGAGAGAGARRGRAGAAGSSKARKWTVSEIEALVGGVQAYGYMWKEILENYGGHYINPCRTTVDLKDKWRNLGKIAKNPEKQTRSIDISDEVKVTILRLVQEHENMASSSRGGAA